MKILFVLGGGLGNIIQATPSIKALSKNGFDIELLINCNTAKDLDIFKIGNVKKIHTQHPNTSYDYQLKGPFTQKIDSRFGKIINPRISYAQHNPEAYVYSDMLNQIGINENLEDAEISFESNNLYNGYVGIYPGCKANWSMKRWDKYDLLCSKFEKVVVFGEEDDVFSHGNPAWIKRPFEWPNNVEFFRSTLKETAGVMSGLDFFIGNDGGLSHLAAATGVCTFVLFGPSSNIKNKPFSSRCHDISLGLECSPCQFRADSNGNQIFGSDKCDCPFDIKCMRDMNVEYVFNKIRSIYNVL
jgi:hypothetical protein